MSTVDFIRGSLKQMHNMYDDAIRDLTSEQMQWRGNDKGQPISFVLWHYVRTEDNIIQFVLQRKPTVWMEGGWDKKFGLHATAQGTGMSLADAQNLRLEPKADFETYMRAVWEATDAYLASADDESLQAEDHRQAARRNAHPERHRQHVPHPRLHPPGRDRAFAGVQGLKGMAV